MRTPRVAVVVKRTSYRKLVVEEHDPRVERLLRRGDPTVATMAARRLDPANQRLPEQIRTLGAGEVFVKFAGEPPRLLRMAQAWRDAEQLGLPPLAPQTG